MRVRYPKSHEWEGAGVALWSVGPSEKGLTMHKRGVKVEKNRSSRKSKVALITVCSSPLPPSLVQHGTSKGARLVQ